MRREDVWILIPAYEPDMRLKELVARLRADGYMRVLVVDDGSGAAFQDVFDQTRDAGATVLGYPVNRGKGAALKTGFQYIRDHMPLPVITCDADGQHTPEDVDKLCEAILESPDAFVLGVRDFAQMPPRSRAGNTVTRVMLGLMTGLWLIDTQTGLRAHPAGMLDMLLALDGDRYEYELHVLMEVRHRRCPVIQVPIATLYFDGNSSSHFSAFRDGLRIYTLLFGKISMYIGSSALSGIVDYGLFTALHYILPGELAILHTGNAFLPKLFQFLFPASFGVPALIARVVSALVNYTINREVVFKSKAGKRSLAFYYLLVFASLILSVQLMKLMIGCGVHALVAKPLADGLMFLVNYNVQQVIFRQKKRD